MVFISNFEFLKAYGVWFYNLAASAERNFAPDPNSTLIKLRQLGEVIAQNIAARVGVEYGSDVKHADLLRDIDCSLRLDDNVRDAFHTLRKLGNAATHEIGGSSHRDALKAMVVKKQTALKLPSF